MDRHNNFDLLRLLAALSVIFSHAFLLAENSQDHDPLMILTAGQTILGLVGVFTFFTISGYLISQSFEQTASRRAVFLAKRALRIFPGLIACLCVCVFAIGPAVTSLPLAEYFSRPQTYLFLLHNAVLDINFNRLPGVEFWQGNIGGIVNGPLWSLPSEALLYLVLCALGLCRLITVPVTLVVVGTGVACLWVDTSGDTIGSTGWLCGFFAAGMCCYRLRNGPRFFERRWIWLAVAGLAISVPLRVSCRPFPIFGGFLIIRLALEPPPACPCGAALVWRSVLRHLHLRLAGRAMRGLRQRRPHHLVGAVSDLDRHRGAGRVTPVVAPSSRNGAAGGGRAAGKGALVAARV